MGGSVYNGGHNVWVCICTERVSTLLARPFASILNGRWAMGRGGDEGAGGVRLLLLLARRCLAGAPCQTHANERVAQRRPQLHAAAKDRGTRRPSLSSVTSDPLSMTRRVHTNMPPAPHQTPTPSPAKEPCHSPPPAPAHRPVARCPLPADDALARILSLAAPLLRPAWLGRSSSHSRSELASGQKR